MIRTIRNRRGSTLELVEYPLDSIPNSVATHLKSKASVVEYSLGILGIIDEKYSDLDIVFLAEFAEAHLDECACGRRN